jgi:hypothetical protein
MPLSSEAQALFDHARNSVPRWLTRGKNTVLEWLYGFTEIFDSARVQAQSWLDLTYILQSFGTNLDQHAKDRGITRRAGESDLALQQRIIQVSDAVTQPALEANINAILAANGLGPCSIVNLRRDKGHYHTTGSSRMFYGRGYRMSYPGRPLGYIVILPYGTTSAIGSGVNDYLRQFGPAGFNHYVEVRAIP